MPVGSSFWIAEGMLHGEIEPIHESGTSGYRIAIRNQFFHGHHPLGWIRALGVAIDGMHIDPQKLFLVVRHQWINARQVPTIYDIWWEMGETAFIVIEDEGAIQPGSHEVAVDMVVTSLGHTPVIDWRNLYPTVDVHLSATLPAARELAVERT